MYKKHPAYVIDCHTHSNWSDGDVPSAELARRAHDAGLEVVFLTDPALLRGWHEFKAACDEYSIQTVPAVELTCWYDDLWFDLLLYGSKTFAPEFNQYYKAELETSYYIVDSYMRWLRDQRALNIEPDIIKREFRLPTAKIQALYWINKYRRDNLGHDFQSCGKDIRDAHLRQEDRVDIYRRGLPRAEDVLRSVTNNKIFCSFANFFKLAKRIAKMSGVTIEVAFNRVLLLISHLRGMGLNAIEVRHSYHSNELQAHLTKWASEQSLYITGGSGYHGDQAFEHSPDIHFGSAGLTLDEYKVIEPLINY